MNPQIKKQWVEALRSGKYKEGIGYLISAAPDLLEACKLALDDFIHGHNFTTTQDKLADAIAKAEGNGNG